MDKLVRITVEVVGTLYNDPKHLFKEGLTKRELDIALEQDIAIKSALVDTVNDKLQRLIGCSKLPSNTKFNVIVK